MNWKNTQERYGKLSIAMHWLMLALLIAVYTCILLREEFPRGSELRNDLKTWHFMLGLSVLGLLVFRLIIRFTGPTPAIQPPVGAWQHRMAAAMHGVLYLFLFAMPVLGWLILSMEGKQIPFFGLELPPLWDQNKDLAHEIEDIHELIGEIGYYLIGAHAAAALFHHYFIRDNTLLRMLPGAERPLRDTGRK
ncbi:cytochrome b [Dokdonella sp.]|uniref:cytochrome b n=1 Tax=Dokdonella sp. TaxID=2291710 RepID=UPI0035282FE8